MATKIEMRYLSEEGSEYLDVVFAGNISGVEWEQLLNAANQRHMEGFIPAQVGLPAPYDERIQQHGLSDADHVSTFFARENVPANSLWTEDAPTDARTISEFVNEFTQQKWDIGLEMARMEDGAYFKYLHAYTTPAPQDQNPLDEPTPQAVAILCFDANADALIQQATVHSPGFSVTEIKRMLAAGQAVILHDVTAAATVLDRAVELFSDRILERGPQITTIALPWQPEHVDGIAPEWMQTTEQVSQRLALMRILDQELAPLAGSAMDPYAFAMPEQRLERMMAHWSQYRTSGVVNGPDNSVMRDVLRAAMNDHGIADSFTNLSRGVAMMQKEMAVLQAAITVKADTCDQAPRAGVSAKPRF